MPVRAGHIPHNIERSALQKLIAAGPLPSSKLYPAGEQTLSKMVQKGLVKLDGSSYAITLAGEAALKAKIPLKR